MSKGLPIRLIGEFVAEFKDLASRLKSPEKFSDFMRELGWDFSEDLVPGLDPVKAVFSNLETAWADFRAAQSAQEKLIKLQTLNAQFISTFTAVKDFHQNFSGISLPTPLQDADYLNQLPSQLINFVIVEFLKKHHSGIYGFLRMGGVVQLEEVPETGTRPQYTNRFLDFSKLGELLTHPELRVQALYQWGTDQFDSQLFLDVLEEVYLRLGAPAGQYNAHPAIASNLLGVDDPTFAEIGKELILTIYESAEIDFGYVFVGIRIYPIPNKDSRFPGLAVVPFLKSGADVEFPIGGMFVLEIFGDVSAGIGIELRPGSTTAKNNLYDVSTDLQGAFEALVRANLPEEGMAVLGQNPGTRLEIQGFSHALGVRVDSSSVSEVYWEINLQGGNIVVASGEGDGFLQKLLPIDGMEVPFEFTVGWSSKDGIYFLGSSALEVTLPVHKSIGPAKVDSIFLSIRASEKGIQATAALSAEAKIGPVFAHIDRVGMKMSLAFPEDGNGNMGILQLDPLQFMPPTGAGLSIDSGPMTGGGFLEFDSEN